MLTELIISYLTLDDSINKVHCVCFQVICVFSLFISFIVVSPVTYIHIFQVMYWE